jgi:uncharacterized protein YjdB
MILSVLFAERRVRTMKKQKHYFIVGMLSLLLAVGLLQPAQKVSAASYYTSYSSVTDDMKNSIHSLILKQNCSLISNQTAIDRADYFMFQSGWKVGNNFPYSNNGSDAGTISDGTYKYDVGSTKGCYAYCRFAQYVFFNGKSETNTRKYSDSSTVTASGIKTLLKTNGQAGEHLRIDNCHSLTFLGADDNGFYALSYEGGPIRLVYFTWSNFAAKYKGYRVWLYNVDTAVNVEDTTAPTVSSVKISNVSNEGFWVDASVSDDVKLDRAVILVCSPQKAKYYYFNNMNGSCAAISQQVSVEDFDNYEGTYAVYVYAYDTSSNFSSQRNEVYIDRTPPVISNVRVTDVTESGYTVLCDVTDDISLDRVQFPTWTEYNDQDDLDKEWNTSTTSRGILVSGNTYSFHVNISDHNNELGNYITHIYAFDSQGNYGFAGTTVEVQKEEPAADDQTGQEGNGATDATATVSAIKITAASTKIAAGKKVSLQASVTPKEATNKTLTWISSNTKYATVSKKGVVTTKAAGAGKTVTITAKATDGSGQSATFDLQIMKGTVKKITAKAASSVKAGGSTTIKTTVKATAGANKKLSFTSSNKKYATVTSKGVVKTYKEGKGKTVKITVAATDGSGKKTTVKIKIK